VEVLVIDQSQAAAGQAKTQPAIILAAAEVLAQILPAVGLS
jgi:hypothetical protein